MSNCFVYSTVTLEVEVEVEEGSLMPSMRETGPEGHYTVKYYKKAQLTQREARDSLGI